MTIIDRYILKQIVMTLFFTLIALCIIFILVDLLENLDRFLDKNVGLFVLVQYYMYMLPNILQTLTPVAMLVSTLFTVGKFSSSNEITAMKTGGQSLYRLMMPIVIFSVLLSFGQMYFNGWIVPKANASKADIDRFSRNQPIRSNQIFDLFFRDSPTKNIIMQNYDTKTKSGLQISIEEFSSPTKPRLLRRVEAERVAWDSTQKKWKLRNGIERVYSENGMSSTYFREMLVEMKITHDELAKLRLVPEEMNWDEYKEYIYILKAGGKDIRHQLINYYGNYAFPFANLIVVLFGVPFASVRKKGGIAIQIGAAMGISFAYLVMTKVSQTIGYSSDIHPIVTAWMANIAFLGLALLTIFKTRT